MPFPYWKEIQCISPSNFMKIAKYLNSLTFRRLGRAGNPLRDVRPTFIRLNTSKFSNSSVSPTMEVLLQLSKFSSVICESKVIRVVKTLSFSSSLVMVYFAINKRKIYKQERMPFRILFITNSLMAKYIRP